MRTPNTEKRTPKRRGLLRTIVLLTLLALPTLLLSCSSNDHMYRHKRSDCDCPRFD